MPEYLAPGVYVEEIQTGNKPIEGVSTSTSGFIGVAERGPVNVPQLVTSFAEYQRLFGGHLPAADFTDGSGHIHAYLPHAVEGFFLNGGKRAYVTRVLPDIATPATRELFFADTGNIGAGGTVLLRPAQQGSGTAVNQPLLYALDPTDIAAGEHVRVGDGSRAEYRVVANIATAQRHVALDAPLRFAHATGAVVDAGAIVNDTTNYTTNPVFTLVNATTPGATEVLVSGADAAVLLTLPGAGGVQLMLFRAAGASDDAAEYAFATAAAAGTGTQVQLTLATPLQRAYAASDDAVAIQVPTGTAAALTLPGNGGDLLIYLDNVSGTLIEPPPAPGSARALVIDAGTAQQEVHGIGALSNLELTVPAYTAYAAGSRGERVNLADDDRAIVGGLTAGPLLTLDRVDSLAPGMSLMFDVGGGETGIIAAVDAVASTITLSAPLSAAPATAAVLVPAKQLVSAAPVGAISIALNDRLGIGSGDVLRIDADEIVSVREVVGVRGPPPDPGALLLDQPLRAPHAAGAQLRRQIVTADGGRQPVHLVLAAGDGADSLLVNDGTAYASGDVLRLTLPDGSQLLHRLAANALPQTPADIELDRALDYSHAAGLPLVERDRLLEVRALDAGAWGNRLLIACRDEASGLAGNSEVLDANPPPGPGMFSSLQVSTVTGLEAGSIIELLDVGGAPLGLPLLKARLVDRATRLVVLDAPGLEAAHMTAHNSAQLAGTRLRLRSREFSLLVMLRQRPDPAVPSRDDNLLDQEVFRNLSMDPRHSRYVMRVVGATFTAVNPNDDLDVPLRRWDRRSEGGSGYVRVLDLGTPAQREAIRIGPEALIDVLPSGLTRPARHPLAQGSDAQTVFGESLYIGIDDNEPEQRTGVHTMKNLLNVSLLAVPGQTGAVLQQALIDHCELMRFRFAVLDGPPPANDTLVDVQNHRQQFDTKYAALYHPWLTIPDPFPTNLAAIGQYAIPPSGHVLGVYARVDNDRGVHKAPANEVLRGITGFTRYFNQAEQDILNPFPVNINVLRDFRPNNRGLRVWGARCITSDNDYKYVNVRRLVIFIEDSLNRGLQWVVFEPNGPELWARVRRAITNFLTTVWRNGALEGTTPEQGFFVKCDRTTMTRDDIDNGRLVVMVGVAPVKPAEFVIIRLGLWTADAEV